MKTRNVVVAILLAIILAPVISWAANPADLTVFHRQFPSRFDMVCYDANDDAWIFTNIPIEKDMNFAFFGSVSEDRSQEAMFIIARKPAPNLDIAFSADTLNPPSSMTNELGIDYQFDNGIAVGTLISMSADDDVKVGLRWTAGNLTLFSRVSLENDHNPRWGVTYKGFFTTEVAYREDVGRTYLRVSKGFPTGLGVIIPGVRLENENGKTTVGFSVAVAY